MVEEAGQLARMVVRRCSAPQVELREAAPLGPPGGDEIDLALEQLEVRIRDVPVRGDDDVTAAEQAPLTAEGEMEVERQRGVRPQPVRFLEPGLVILGAESFVKFDGGRVAGIPWA